ncbi:hypothetical protein V491_00270 [Pseudogymnoascus sp. VKM F-3775]|nr:hypothetical protein V491_00270 [Pseudogymnoascus sp. VKM F-3775]
MYPDTYPTLPVRSSPDIYPTRELHGYYPDTYPPNTAEGWKKAAWGYLESRNPQSPGYLAQQIAEILPFNRLTSHAKLFGKAIIRQEIMSTIPSPLDARHLIEVKATEGKGLVIFAKEKIPRGTRLVATLLKAPINHTTRGADVMRAFNNLSASSQQAYLELHGYASEDTKKRHNWDMLGDLDRQVFAVYVANC